MTARWELLPRAQQRVMPWQNCFGTTRQVAIDTPEGSLATGFRWRISVAMVGQGGPFSHLPGVDRALWLVRGNGMRLAMPDREVVLAEPFARLDFQGETPIEAALLDGPCEDCNVMTRRGEVVAAARVVQLAAHERLGVESAPQQVLLVLAGSVRVEARALALGEGDALLVEGDAEFAVVASEASTVLLAAFVSRRDSFAGELHP